MILFIYLLQCYFPPRGIIPGFVVVVDLTLLALLQHSSYWKLLDICFMRVVGVLFWPEPQFLLQMFVIFCLQLRWPLVIPMQRGLNQSCAQHYTLFILAAFHFMLPPLRASHYQRLDSQLAGFSSPFWISEVAVLLLSDLHFSDESKLASD